MKSKRAAITQRQLALTDDDRCGPTGCWERASALTLVTKTGERRGQRTNVHRTQTFVAMAPPDKLGKMMGVKPREQLFLQTVNDASEGSLCGNSDTELSPSLKSDTTLLS